MACIRAALVFLLLDVLKGLCIGRLADLPACEQLAPILGGKQIRVIRRFGCTGSVLVDLLVVRVNDDRRSLADRRLLGLFLHRFLFHRLRCLRIGGFCSFRQALRPIRRGRPIGFYRRVRACGRLRRWRCLLSRRSDRRIGIKRRGNPRVRRGRWVVWVHRRLCIGIGARRDRWIGRRIGVRVWNNGVDR